jgi:hypothetical protein
MASPKMRFLPMSHKIQAKAWFSPDMLKDKLLNYIDKMVEKEKICRKLGVFKTRIEGETMISVDDFSKEAENSAPIRP